MGEELKYVPVYDVKPGEVSALIINFLEARGIDAEIIVNRVAPRIKSLQIMVPKTHYEEAKAIMHEWEIGGFENTEYPDGGLYMERDELGDTEDLGGYFT